MKKLFLFLKKISNIPICLQIAHAGRKGSSYIPWVKKNTPLKKFLKLENIFCIKD